MSGTHAPDARTTSIVVRTLDNASRTSSGISPTAWNRAERKVSTIPRHRDVNEFLALKICKDLGVPKPGV